METINPVITARKGLYLIASLADRLQKRSVKGPIVLCYHSFGSDKWLHGVNVSTFEKQLRYLSDKYKQTSVDQIEELINGAKIDLSGYFLITIDDGYQDVLKIRKIIKKYNINPILFLLSDKDHLNRQEMDNKKAVLNYRQVKQLMSEGWLIGSHGATHSDFYRLSEKQLIQEIVGSKKVLDKSIGKKVKYFAYPKGRYTKKILKLVEKAGYKAAFAMDDGFITTKTNKYIIPRIGVNRTHSMSEFAQMMSPLAIQIRGYIKERIKGLAI